MKCSSQNQPGLGSFRARRRQRLGAMLLILSLAGAGSFVSGNPAGEVVRHGHVSFDRQGSTLTIQQQSSRAIVDWDSFSISLGEVTDFQQPNSQAAMLNRVTGGTRSQIDGLLRSNGNVFLQNPSGIVIGPTGSIDVGGLIATTLEIPEDEFLAGGDLNLKGITEAEVINLGEISARDGDVYLLAKEVRNEGRIEASNGRVGLAAGTEILLREKGEERISVRASSGLSKEAGVTNSGVIEATVAELKAHGGSIYGLAVKNEGRVAATSVTKSGGQIFLSAGQGGTLLSSGTLSATREGGKTGGEVSVRADEGAALIGGIVDVSGTERGGEVRIEGNSVEIVEAATIQASGDGQGGRVLVGGGREGQDPTMQNAAFTTVGDGVVVDVSAKVAGDAGEAIYFAEDTLAYHGFTLANGGMETGNGGFVELSGKKRVTFDGFVEAADVSASNGTDGHLLFDPVDIVIRDGTGGVLFDGDGKPGSDTVFNDDSIANFLESSGSLEIRTDGGDTGAGDITIEDGVEIVWTTGNDLTLRADRHIQFSGGATMESQTGNISLLAAGSIVAGGMGDGGAEFTRDVGYPSGDQVSMVSVSGDILVMGGSAGEQRDSVSLTDVMIETGGDVDIQGTSEAPDGFGVFLDRGSIQGGRVRVIGSGGEEGANVSLSQLTVSEGGEVYLQGDAITGVGLNVASPIHVVDGSATVTLDGKTLAQEADAVFLKGHDDSTGTVNLTLRSRGGSVNADSGMLTVNDLMLDNEEGSQDDFEFLGSAVSEIAGRGQLGDVMATSLSTGVKLKGIQSAGTVEVASEDAIKVIGASSASTFRLEAPQIDIDAPITASEVNLFGPAASPSSELTIFNVSAPINSSSISATAFLSPADELNIDGEFQPSLWTLTGIDSIVGVGESDALRGTDQGDAFFITGETSTFLGGATYENFERLLGGGGNDVFDFLVEAPRTIDGGEDTDFLRGVLGADDDFLITAEDAGNLNGGINFSSIEVLRGRGGDDTFTFLNQATVGLVDGGLGEDQLFIDDSTLDGAGLYTITEGLVTRNPVYPFIGIEGLSIAFGPGSQIVRTDSGTSFFQDLDGGEGFDSLFVDGEPAIGRTFARIQERNFEGLPEEFREGEELLQVELGDVLPFLDEVDDEFLVENLFNEPLEQLPPIEKLVEGLLDVEQGVVRAELVRPVQLADVAGRLPVDGEAYLLKAPASLGGSFQEAPLVVIQLLRENTGIPAFTELASAISFEGGVTMDRPDGPFALDLSGVPPLEVLPWLQENLLLGAAQELFAALDIPMTLPATQMDGAVSISVVPIIVPPEVFALLTGNLDGDAFDELGAALDE